MFEVEKKRIKTLFNETKSFLIPDFQRGFAWGLEEIDEFYEDLINESLFFIGSFILKVNPDSKTERVEIIDGQQRTVTLTLFYVALSHLLDNLIDQEDLADAKLNAHELRKSIAEVDPERPTNISKFKVNFQNADTNDFFASLLNEPDINKVQNNTDLYKRVLKAYKRIKELIEKDTKLNYSKLIEVKQKIENTELILINIQKDELAYQIFETVNARGVDLTVAELLKNHLFKTISDHSQLKNTWAEITDNLKQTQIKQLDLSTGLRFYWISNFEHVTKRRLYRAIKDKLANGQITENTLLEDIHRFSGDLSRIYDSDQNRWIALFNKSSKERRQAARWFYYKDDSIRVFPKSIQYLPIFTSILKQKEKLDITSPAFRKLIHAIESINFIYLEIMVLPGNVLEKIYGEYSRKISQAETSEDLTLHITNLYTGLVRIIRERADQKIIAKYISELSYASKRDKEIIRFIFTRLEYLQSDFGITVNPLNISVEHIYSQSGIDEESVSEKLAHSIGNLTIMEFSGPNGNGSLNNIQFSDKKDAYRKSPYAMTRDLCNYVEWTMREIDTRSKKLTELVWQVWGPNQELKNFNLPSHDESRDMSLD